MNTHSTECNSCLNDNCIIKKHLSEPGIEKFLESKNTMRCRKSQSIIIEGAPIHGLYFVHTGKVKVFNTGINGREQILRFAHNGEMLGQRGFSSSQCYPSGAVALSETRMCHFTLDNMRNMLKSLPNMAYDFMVYYAEELNRSETKVRMFAHMTVREKVIDALLYINRKFGLKDGYLAVQLSRKDIADFAGTTEEQVIRIISGLKKEKLIICKGKLIGIPDKERLGKEIDEHHYFIQS